MGKIEIVRAFVESNTIHYEVRQDPGVGLLQQDSVRLFIRSYCKDGLDFDFANIPLSILILPISLYLIPITYFYNVELVIPEMDKELFERLPYIYSAYSKIYGPFEEEWRGRISVKKIVANEHGGTSKYDRIVFFSGGVDACHAGINNPGPRTLLVSIPDIECLAKNEGPLRGEKFSLIKNFANAINSDWLLIANNFNTCLFRDQEIMLYLGKSRGLSSPAFKFDGWPGIKYIANMCCVAPFAYSTRTYNLIMGSSYEEIDGNYAVNLDGANPEITNSISFANISFAEQEGLCVRRSTKVGNVIQWCKAHGIKIKLWACFADRSTQCGFCGKCVRTQLNILCAGENPREWGFDEFSKKKFEKFIRAYQYRESNPCWLWDNIDSIDDDRTYPHLDELLHWLKRIGYKEYTRRAERKANPSILIRLFLINRYPHYARVVFRKTLGHVDD